MADITTADLFALGQRLADDLALLDRAIKQSPGPNQAVLSQTRNGLQRVRSKLMIGLNGYTDVAKSIKIYDSDLDDRALVQSLINEHSDVKT